VGRIIREVRIRKGWRQTDLAVRAGVSQRTISEIELGRLEHVGLAILRRVGAAIDVSVSTNAWWRGGDVDRLLDRAHAALVDHVVRELAANGWTTRLEFTFNRFGERGSADIVAWHPTYRILLIIEVKTRIGDVQETLSTLARKARVIPALVQVDVGWRPRAIGRILVLADSSVNRRLVADHRATFDSEFPARTSAVRRLVRGGDSALATPSGLWFVPYSAVGSGHATIKAVVRVRRPRRVAGRLGPA